MSIVLHLLDLTYGKVFPRIRMIDYLANRIEEMA
jgi:hypothetical protein